MDYALREIQSIINSISPDVHARVFKLSDVSSAGMEEDVQYEPYLPARAPVAVNTSIISLNLTLYF